MIDWWSMWSIAVADFRERTRRYSFFLALLFAVFLGYAAATGKIFLRLDEYRGVYTSGWIGTLVALMITCFVSLVGFYIVKNTVERDRATGVGQILAATPLSKTVYAFGKFLSNFAVLSSMVGILALAALLMQFWVGEDTHIHLWALLSPFLLLALPAIALTAVLALCFELVPFLRGSFGNVAWFFVWNLGLIAPIVTKRDWIDPSGLIAVMGSLGEEAKRYVPNYHGGMSFQIDIGQHTKVVEAWRWPGIAWDGRGILLRVMWIAVACAMVPLAALVFDRFDTAKVARAGKRERKGSVAVAGPEAEASRGAIASAAEVHLTPLANTRSSGFVRIFAPELRLALLGRRWWWYVVALGLLIAEIFAPLEVSRGPILGSAWMWSVLVWSPMGARESLFSTRQLIFPCAKVLPRQLLGCFLAGAAVAFLTGAGTGERLVMAGNSGGLLAWVAGALVLPSLAICLGVLSGTGKPFEGVVTVLWYVGTLNHVPGLDFTGAANGAHTVLYAIVALAFAAALLACGFALRGAQIRSG